MTWSGSQHNQRLAGSGWEDNRAAKRILERDGYRCYFHGPDCVGAATQTDHVIPLYITGPAGDHDGNKKAICRPCHAQKSSREAADARARKSRKRPPEKPPGLL